MSTKNNGTVVKYGTREALCSRYASCLTNAQCRGYRCRCKPGLAGDGIHCTLGKPANCSTAKDCDKNAVCMDGGCHCLGEFLGDGRNCTRRIKKLHCNTVDFCGDKGMCVVHKDLPSTTLCKCMIGYVLNDKQMCVASNIPCTDDKDCSSKAKCEHGLCVCQGNRVGNGRECRDAKPCTGKHNCLGSSKCLVDPVMPGEKLCKCPPNQVHQIASNKECVDCVTDKHCKGAELCEGFKCKRPDLHPCDSSKDCDRNAECRDKKCHCKEKYAGNGLSCTESLPCPVAHECDANSTCIRDPNYPYSPYCRCKAHFEKSDDGACIDIDECKTPNKCPAKHKCVNMPGFYECPCKEGYEKGDGDECVKMKCSCGDNGKCDDDGKCTCNEGYEKDGEGVCEDIDECKKGAKCTGDGEKCVNEPGGHSCLCRAGYVNNHGGCVKEPQCKCTSHEECFNGKCRCKKGYKRNSKGMCARKRGLVGSGYSVHVTSHLGTLGLVLMLLGRLAVTA